ncbi:uncharacterized protein UBRO_08537 [Ustilago bromivora]|uniref:Store-operated calcium entry-associated regulatory factor n=1 Tax=Ustilago bromivora TaxID=307758 RepID=A0A1K0GDH7_9BASI|nr:uncharacterized protein UBRO_08537 [Ustilago bromivora]SYW80760.1 uncharacterized protein UBRO2_03974 [Ustilago bromivora]
MIPSVSASKRKLRIASLTTALTLLLATITPTLAFKPNAAYYGAGRRIPMDSIRTLTFYSDKRTAYRRTSPLPQLTCVGSMCSRYKPDVIQCQAMGDNQWKCSADLPSTMRLGRVEVSCEGYDYADDPFVLKDSCALEYHLLPSGRGPDDPWRNYRMGRKGAGESVIEGLFQLAFWGILGAIVIGFIRAIRGNAAATTAGAGGRGGWGGGGGGWGGGGWWPGGGAGGFGGTPPPPYTAKPEPGTSTDSSSSSWRPGFWTGLGLGGLAATAAANRRRTQPSFFGASDYDYGYGGGGFGAGPSMFGGGGGGRRRGWDDDDRGIGGSGMGGFRESTGFGGTRNR